MRDVAAARDRLDDPADAEALHDFRVALRRLRTWLRAFRAVLRDTVRGKTVRRLARVADATGASRDLEVHIDWVNRARRQLKGEERKGATWLLKRLRDDKATCDAELRRVLDDAFDKTLRRVEKALSRYEARVEGELSYADVAGEIVERHLQSLASGMEAVTGLGDRAQAHAARIATKRLRYILEIVAPADSDQARAIVTLKELQDRLGELHDAQTFGSELASLIAERVAENVSAAKAGPNGGSHAKPVVDPVPGLEALLRKLREREKESFRLVAPVWQAAAGGLGID